MSGHLLHWKLVFLYREMSTPLVTIFADHICLEGSAFVKRKPSTRALASPSSENGNSLASRSFEFCSSSIHNSIDFSLCLYGEQRFLFNPQSFLDPLQSDLSDGSASLLGPLIPVSALHQSGLPEFVAESFDRMAVSQEGSSLSNLLDDV